MKTREVPAPVRLLSVEELAGLLQVPVGTIHQWRVRGGGPKALRVGRHLRFDPADVIRWIEHRKTSTSRER